MAGSNNTVKPQNYKIHLEPDLKNFNFRGVTEIAVEAIGAVREIVLDLKELAVRQCQVKLDDRRLECAFQIDPAKQELKVLPPENVEGELTVEIRYVGEINDKMAGFYRSKYISGGQAKYLAVTQFQESDARRAFPCFDSPAAKATFEVEILVDEGLVAISNAPVKEQIHSGSGKRLVRFKKTPRMSTYLLFFGVGEFEFLEDPGSVTVRAATAPGMKEKARFGLDFGCKALEYCEQYFGITYPLPKLDLIAVPDFAFGAMENWGAITFRENLLLYFPGVTSKAAQERICEVIAHEIVHQWFGNLVTPADWRYLWLNESFATYFGYRVVQHYHPEWEIGHQFLQGQTDAALNRDGLQETFPIELPGAEHVLINVSSAPIIYNKGGSVLRQIEGYIGPKNFRAGLRNYLRRYAYGCAASRDLWESLESASQKPVSRVMQNWVEQAGYPLVEARRDANLLQLKQQRFTYLPNESEQIWMVPIRIELFRSNGDKEEVTKLFEWPSTTISIGADVFAYKINAGQSGFYRVKYCDGSNLKALKTLVASRTLSSEDRWGLQNDLYALLRKRELELDDYLDFLGAYAEEDAYLPLISIAGNLYHAYLILDQDRRAKIAVFGRKFFEKTLAKIGYEPDAEEMQTRSILRDVILVQSAIYGSTAAEAFGQDKFERLMKGKNLPPDIMRSVMQIGALQRGEEAFAWFVKRLRAAESEHERMNILTALGYFQEDRVIRKALAYVLDEVPSRNRFVPLAAMAGNQQAIPILWDWFVEHLEALEQFHPIHFERVMAGFVPVAGVEREDAVRKFFQSYLQEKKIARDVVKLSLERLEINSRMRSGL